MIYVVYLVVESLEKLQMEEVMGGIKSCDFFKIQITIQPFDLEILFLPLENSSDNPELKFPKLKKKLK